MPLLLGNASFCNRSISALLTSGFILLCSTSVITSADNVLSAVPTRVTAPNYSLPDRQKNLHTLIEHRGNVVIINFWATWCGPCREELPSMNRAWQQLRDKRVKMIAINVSDNQQAIDSFLADYPIAFTVLLDTQGKAVKHWPVKGLPTSFVIDTKGNIVYQVAGDHQWDNTQTIHRITSLLKPNL